MLTRRAALIGIGAALAAPAIVKYANIMPVRNRLWQQSSLYVPDLSSFQTFSCWLKGGKGLPLHLIDNDCTIQQTLDDVGRGWYRYTATMAAGDTVKLMLPSEVLWGAQMECGKDGVGGLTLSGPNGGDGGVQILPVFEKDWRPGLVTKE